jgi:hypothetical protein
MPFSVGLAEVFSDLAEPSTYMLVIFDRPRGFGCCVCKYISIMINRPDRLIRFNLNNIQHNPEFFC